MDNGGGWILQLYIFQVSYLHYFYSRKEIVKKMSQLWICWKTLNIQIKNLKQYLAEEERIKEAKKEGSLVIGRSKSWD